MHDASTDSDSSKFVLANHEQRSRPLSAVCATYWVENRPCLDVCRRQRRSMPLDFKLTHYPDGFHVGFLDCDDWLF